VLDALRSRILSGGPTLAAFERAVAARAGVAHAVAVSRLGAASAYGGCAATPQPSS